MEHVWLAPVTSDPHRSGDPAMGVFPANRTNEAIAKLQEFIPPLSRQPNVLEAAINNPNPSSTPLRRCLV